MSRTLYLLESNKRTICNACLQLCCKGFMYTDGIVSYDLICCSVTLPLIHGSHPHPSLYQETEYRDELKCKTCSSGLYDIVLGCKKCNYFLDFHCATLPSTVRLDRYDDHPLTLCYGEKANGKYWCDICERETNPETWFYTCNDCGVTLHVFCVLGNIRYAKPRGKLNDDIGVLFNKTSTRPVCSNCHCRCAAPFFLVKENKSFCSYYCVMRIKMNASDITESVRCPPWVDHE